MLGRREGQRDRERKQRERGEGGREVREKEIKKQGERE
jgi:hypothetical protein